MSDYIKRDDLLSAYSAETVEKEYSQEDLDDMLVSIGSVRQQILEAKAQDVETVRHGKWIPFLDEVFYDGSLFECSACGEWFTFTENCNDKYCPRCGARMDQE